MPDWNLCDCPHCGNTLRIDAGTAEEWAQCPACRRYARIADLLAGPMETAETEAPEPVAREGAFAWTGSSYSARSIAGKSAAETHPDSDAGPIITGELDDDSLPGWESPFPESDAPGQDLPQEGEWVEDDGWPADPSEEPYEFEYGEMDWAETEEGEPVPRRAARKRHFGLFCETPEWEDIDPRSRGRDISGKRVIATGVGIVAVGAVVLAVAMLTSSGRTGGEAKPAENVFSPIVLPTDSQNALSVPEAMKKLRHALEIRPQETIITIKPAVEAFLNAANWQERGRRVRDPERVLPLMEGYYQTHGDGPIPFLSVGDAKDKFDYRDNLLVLRILLRDYSTKQIAIEYTGADFLIDWESFVGFGEMPMERFREERPIRPVLMRASFAPAVPPYFNYAFTDEPNLECHLLTFPDDSYLFGYTLKFSTLSNRLKELRGDAPSAMAVLKLRYPENAKVGDQVWIDDIVAEGWILHEATLTSKP